MEDVNWSREMESRNGVAKKGVAKWSHEDESRNGVTKWSRQDESRRGGCKNEKFGGVCDRFPKGSTKLITNIV